MEWLNIQVRQHHVIVELHMFLPRPTPAQKLDGGDDGGGEADMSCPKYYGRDLVGLARHEAAEVGINKAAPGFPERRPKPVAQSTGHQVRCNILLDERDRFPIARASAAEPSETVLTGNRGLVVNAHDGHAWLHIVLASSVKEGMDEQNQHP